MAYHPPQHRLAAPWVPLKGLGSCAVPTREPVHKQRCLKVTWCATAHRRHGYYPMVCIHALCSPCSVMTVHNNGNDTVMVGETGDMRRLCACAQNHGRTQQQQKQQQRGRPGTSNAYIVRGCGWGAISDRAAGGGCTSTSTSTWWPSTLQLHRGQQRLPSAMNWRPAVAPLQLHLHQKCGQRHER